MAFEHACFVSYRRHEQSPIADRLIAGLYEALKYELALMVEEGLFLDRTRMQGGQFLDPSLARALCKSICMIVIYTPTYFSRGHLYCAREYRAMEALEKNRLSVLQGAQRDTGFIIPIILRGADDLPPAFGKERLWYNFEKYTLSSLDLSQNSNFESDIRGIVRVIRDRKRALAPFADQLTAMCQAFALPTEDEVLGWLDSITPSVTPFPGGR